MGKKSPSDKKDKLSKICLIIRTGPAQKVPVARKRVCYSNTCNAIFCLKNYSSIIAFITALDSK